MPLQQVPPLACLFTFLILFFSFGLSAQQDNQPLTLSLAQPQILQSRLNAGLVPYKQREETIAALFRQAGCAVKLQTVTHSANNVICTLPGADPALKPIVVGAHLDFIDAGQGIIDDWSGTSLLVSLYETLKKAGPKHTFLFVAFAKEEVGLVGSSKFVSELEKPRRDALRAFINLECLGTSPTKVWVRRSNKDLVDMFAMIASRLQTAAAGMNVDGVGDDDTHPFADVKIPVVSIHSLTSETFHYLHSKKDRLEAVQMTYYADSYRLIAFFLAYLDAHTSINA